jgi:large subunit ribosomal protein L13
MKRLRTFRPKEVEGMWFTVDATDKVLGRVSTEIALRLRGKHKPIFDPSCDHGDFIVVINASKIKVTGEKAKNKLYQWHTGFPGGIKTETFEKKIVRRPEQVIMLAVKRMLPKGPLGYKILKKLKVYAGSEHPHQAQSPQVLSI